MWGEPGGRRTRLFPAQGVGKPAKAGESRALTPSRHQGRATAARSPRVRAPLQRGSFHSPLTLKSSGWRGHQCGLGHPTQPAGLRRDWSPLLPTAPAQGCSRQIFPGWSGGGIRGFARNHCTGERETVEWAEEELGRYPGSLAQAAQATAEGCQHAVSWAGAARGGSVGAIGGRPNWPDQGRVWGRATEYIHSFLQ